jgi:hypothetical protein
VETKRKTKVVKILDIAGVVAYYGDDVNGTKTKKRGRRRRRRNFSSQ